MMGKKILLLSVVASVVIIWSSLIVGVRSSDSSLDLLLRHKRQSDGDEKTDDTAPKETPAPDVKPAASSGDNTTLAPNTAPNSTVVEVTGDKQEGDNTVTVTVVIVILVVAIVLGVVVFIFLRMRKRRMADYDKKTQIQMSSTSNAGVYVDLTSAPATEKEKQPDSSETEHLNKEEV